MSSSAQYIDDLLGDDPSDLGSGQRDVANFYAGRKVLLTGGTGFLGKLLIERILRSCPKVRTLFLLVRKKKGKNSQERFKELFDDLIFDRMRRETPDFAQKVVLIEGDMGQIGLGLSSEQRELLRSTHIIIHGAATVKFNEKLGIAASINVGGTKELLLFAKEMVDLKAFVYISTAYCNCVHKVIDEIFYPSPIDSDKLLSLLDILDEASLDYVTPSLLGKWPNTYAFTKAVAENVILRNSGSLPVCIVRPSIIISTSKEPIPGWINNFYGVTGILVGIGIGFLRVMLCDEELITDVVPADYVVNNIIVAAWDIAKAQSSELDRTDNSMAVKDKRPTIFNAVSSSQNPISFNQVMEYGFEYVVNIPFSKSIWYYFFIFTKHKWTHKLCILFLHLIPAATVDTLAWLIGRKPMLYQMYKKIHKNSSVLEYFMTQQWQFHNNNVLRLWERLGPADRKEFDLDIGSLNWHDFFFNYISGIRIYLMKDPLDNVPQALAKHVKLKIAHYSLMTFLGVILVWFSWMVWRFIW